MNPEPENTDDKLADEAIDWLVSMRSGSVTPETRREFERWLQQNHAHRQAYANAEALWGVTASVLKEAQAGRIAIRHAGGKRKISQGLRISSLQGLAVAATFIFSVYLLWTPGTIWLRSDFSTSVGEQKQLMLSDGSSVFLNTDTAISLDFSESGRRIVLLKGQAEFKVAKDVKRPFEVLAGNTSVRALGTVFEVFEQSSGAVEVSVAEHAVAVNLVDNSASAGMRVEEGQRLHYVGAGELQQPAQVGLNRIGAWKRGKLIFRDQPLTEVVAELNRYSKARIVLKGIEVEQLRVSGVFPVDGLEMLNALQTAFPIHSTQLGPWLVILHS